MILLPTALKSPAAFHEQRRSLERARVRHLASQGFLRAFSKPVVLLSSSFQSSIASRVSPGLTVLNRKLWLFCFIPTPASPSVMIRAMIRMSFLL